MSDPCPASAHTRAAHADASKDLPFEDREDFEDARRGLIATAPSLVLRDERGRVVWDMDSYDFVHAHEDEGAEGEVGQAPDTVHPSLWRMAQLNGIHGLFEVVPGIYQVRGYDLSNMTLVEGNAGVIVIDPLISTECAAAALALYREHRGERKVSAVIYTHSHVDHFGGVKGVVSAEQVQAGEVPVWAPAGFLEHAVSENVLAGGAMARRASYMFAPALERGPRGQVDAGIGKTTSSGSITLIPPTHEVSHTGQESEIDGVPIVFQLVPDSEAPAEMNFTYRSGRAVCGRERRPLHAQCTDPAGRARYAMPSPGPSTWERRSSCSVRDRGDVRPAPLAALGQRARGRAFGASSRHVSLPARPNVALGQQGPHTHRDRCGGALAAEPRAYVVVSRLLRHRQSQRARRLPALPGFLRRQSSPSGPVSAG